MDPKILELEIKVTNPTCTSMSLVDLFFGRFSSVCECFGFWCCSCCCRCCLRRNEPLGERPFANVATLVENLFLGGCSWTWI